MPVAKPWLLASRIWLRELCRSALLSLHCCRTTLASTCLAQQQPTNFARSWRVGRTDALHAATAALGCVGVSASLGRQGGCAGGRWVDVGAGGGPTNTCALLPRLENAPAPSPLVNPWLPPAGLWPSAWLPPQLQRPCRSHGQRSWLRALRAVVSSSQKVQHLSLCSQIWPHAEIRNPGLNQSSCALVGSTVHLQTFAADRNKGPHLLHT